MKMRTACVLAAGLLPMSRASAGPFLHWLFPDDGPAPAYSPLRYWAPGLGLVYDKFHGPKVSVYPPDRHPEVPPTDVISRYPCPPVDPAALWDGNRNVPNRTAATAAGIAPSLIG